jgi:hypothetical protein
MFDHFHNILCVCYIVLFFALDLFATITKIYQPGNQLKSTTWTETQSQTTSKVWITRDRSTGLGTHVQFLCLVCWLWAKLFEEHLHIKITKTIGRTVVWNSSSEGTFKMFKVCLTNSQLNWRLVKISFPRTSIQTNSANMSGGMIFAAEQ